MADFIKQVRENYFIGTFTLDSVAKKPNESLAYLKKYDLAIIAKPTEKFTDEEKLHAMELLLDPNPPMEKQFGAKIWQPEGDALEIPAG